MIPLSSRFLITKWKDKALNYLNYLLTNIIDNGDFVAIFFEESEDKEDILLNVNINLRN